MSVRVRECPECGCPFENIEELKAKSERLDAVIAFLEEIIEACDITIANGFEWAGDVARSHIVQIAYRQPLQIAKGESDE